MVSSSLKARKVFLIVGMTNIYPLIRDSDHLLNYFSLIHRCGININLLLLIFISRSILIILCKRLIITVIFNEKSNEL